MPVLRFWSSLPFTCLAESGAAGGAEGLVLFPERRTSGWALEQRVSTTQEGDPLLPIPHPVGILASIFATP